MAALFAFLHHIAAFALVAALAIELVAIKDQMNAPNIRKLAIADMIVGISAGIILVVGFIRVFYFEKGASYYFHSAPFIIKLTLFVMVALLSIYPTLHFLSWRKAVKQGRVPAIAPATLRTVRLAIHVELTAIIALILCAALMARGVGYLP